MYRREQLRFLLQGLKEAVESRKIVKRISIISIWVITTILVIGCIDYPPEATKYYFDCGIVEIDSCEYLQSGVNGGYAYTHKGNCKYCAERDSITWERRKRELILLIN